MKRLFVSLLIGISISSCGNDDAKIEALEEKLNQQEQAMQAEKQADLEKELAE